MSGNATLVEQSYSIIREHIISGTLEPDSPLRIDRLKDSYRIGASPIREALSRLLTDGLVTSEGLKGFRVAPVSLIDLRDITDARKIVETSTLRLSIERGDSDWEGHLVAAHYHLSRSSERQVNDPAQAMAEIERLNRNFHLALIQGSNSPHLVRICTRLFDFSLRYRNISLRHNPDRPREVNNQHAEIYEAALRRDANTAADLLADHIEETYRSVFKAFDADISSKDQIMVAASAVTKTG